MAAEASKTRIPPEARAVMERSIDELREITGAGATLAVEILRGLRPS